MAENVYEVLKDSHQKLVEDVLDKNEEISRFLMLVYSHVLYTASERSENPANLIFFPAIVQERLLILRMRYKRDREEELRRTVLGQNPVQRNLKLAELMRVNKNVNNIAVDVVRVLERWIDEKPYRKEQGITNLRLEYPMFMGGDLTFTAELVFKIEFDELVRAKLKWPDEPELYESPETPGGLVLP
jgi:hypothetical protein